MPTPSKALTSVIQADLEAVAVALKQLVKDTGTKSRNVNIALPESKVFTRVIEVPQLSRDNKQTGNNKMEVLLVAAPKALIDKYLTIMEMADLTVVGAETEIIATSRAVGRSMPNVKTVMVVSLGAQTSDIAILQSGTLMFTRSVSAGGEALTRSIAQSLDFNLTQAEEYKRAYGLQKDKLEGKITTATKPIMDTITNEIKRALAFYEEKNKEEHIETIMLTGGTARLPGMVIYLAEALGVEVQLANPWVGIAKDQRFNVLNPEGPNFCIAVGLALR
jgi:type IV pilus assembly protein PilM